MSDHLFNRNSFYDLNINISLSFLIENINMIQDSKILKDFQVLDISSLNHLRDNSILFLNSNNKIKNSKSLTDIKNIHLITDSLDIINHYNFKSYSLVKNIKNIYSKIVNNLFIHPDHINYNDNFNKIGNSFISSKAKVSSSAKIGINCIIGKGTIIGNQCIIKDNAIIKNSLIGNNVIINEGSVIGSSGFGFNLNNNLNNNDSLEPQIGIVNIGSNCSIGAKTTIDRGKIDSTIIGRNSKLDNQIHIAHNVILGENNIIAAQTGISGSTVTGNNVVIGGQVGISGHLCIGDNVMIAAKSGVTKNISNNKIVAGFPATDIKKWKKIIIKQRSNI